MKPASKPFPSQEESMKTLRNLFAAALATAAILFTVGCPTPSEPTPPEEPVAAVTFDPDGGTVKSGSSVTLDTATDDAEIWYAIAPETEITDANVQEMIDKGSMTSTANVSVTLNINKDCTIYAVAVRGSTGKKSSVTKASYTLAITPGTVAFDPANGTVVPSGTKVKLSATPAQGEESCTIYYSLTTALTDENYSTAGTVYDQAGDGIEITANTTIHAIAVGTANNPGNPSSASYTLPVTLMNAAPEADDVVYIYYPTGKNVMLSTPDGSELSKADVTLLDESGSFTTTDSMAALTVFKNEIGQYVFVSGGKYLTTTTRNNLTLSDTFSVFALWEVAAISEGSNTFYIHSANSIYNNTRQGLEYYNNKFSAYDRRTQEIYQFQFYKDPSKASELNAEAKASLALQANSLATPTFSLTGGDENPVVAGTKIFLSSLSLDVDFYYTTDGSDITNTNYVNVGTKYDATNGIEITGNQGDKMTVNAIAVKTVSEGEATRGIFSLIATQVYTVGEDTNTYLTKVQTLENDDVVAIYYPQEKTTISSSASGTGFSGTASTVSSKGLVLTDSLTQFTVKKLGKSGYVFVNGGKYLSRSDSNGLVLADAFTDNSVWILEQAGSSTDSFYIKNAGDSTKYIEFYNVFTVYSFQSSNTAIYTFQFYKNESGTAENVTLSVLPVSFSVPGGSAVEANSTIGLTSNNGEGTEIYWMWQKNGTLSNENYSSASAMKYDDANKPTVTENGTLQAIAVKNGQTSEVSTAAYTLKTANVEVLSIESASKVIDKDSSNELAGTAHTGTRNDSAQNIQVIFNNAKSSIDFSKPSSGTNPAYYKSGNGTPPVHIRMYGSNTLTITSNNDATNITAITIKKTEGATANPSNIVADSGSVAGASTDTVTWTGSANKIVFTNNATKGHARISEITITYAE